MPSSYIDRLDDEDEPRNAAAIRTAILLGAEYKIDTVTGMWTIEGYNLLHKTKTWPAWMYLIVHGIGIDRDAKPIVVGVVHTSEEP